MNRFWCQAFDDWPEKKWYRFSLSHTPRRALASDWWLNSFIMTCYRNVFNIQSQFSVQNMTKKIYLVDHDYKTTYESVSIECFSSRVFRKRSVWTDTFEPSNWSVWNQYEELIRSVSHDGGRWVSPRWAGYLVVDIQLHVPVGRPRSAPVRGVRLQLDTSCTDCSENTRDTWNVMNQWKVGRKF